MVTDMRPLSFMFSSELTITAPRPGTRTLVHLKAATGTPSASGVPGYPSSGSSAEHKNLPIASKSKYSSSSNIDDRDGRAAFGVGGPGAIVEVHSAR